MKRITRNNSIIMLLLMLGCLFIWKLTVFRRCLGEKVLQSLKITAKAETAIVADDEESDFAVGKDRQMIARLKRSIRRNKMIEREARRALQEEEFLEMWNKQNHQYRCTFYDLFEDMNAEQSLKENRNKRQEDMECAWKQLESFLKRTDLTKLSLEEREQLEKYKLVWKEWVSKAYDVNFSNEEKMVLYQQLRRQNNMVQTLLIRNLDRIHQYPVNDFVEKYEKIKQASQTFLYTGSRYRIDDPRQMERHFSVLLFGQ